MRNPRKKQRLTPANKFARQAFSFCLIFFAAAKKWDYSLSCGLPSLRSGSSSGCALLVESRWRCHFFVFFPSFVINPRKKQSLTSTNKFVRQAFFFLLGIFCCCKKWDCSLVSGCLALLALRSEMLRLFVESLFSMF